MYCNRHLETGSFALTASMLHQATVCLPKSPYFTWVGEREAALQDMAHTGGVMLTPSVLELDQAKVSACNSVYLS